MIEVKNMNDIQKLRAHGILPEDFFGYMEMFLYELYLYLENGEEIEEFSLDGNGYFVILEDHDDVRNLGDAGLNPEDGGLLGYCPKRAEILEWSDDTKKYWISVVCAESYVMNFYSKQGQIDNEVEQWLNNQCCRLEG